MLGRSYGRFHQTLGTGGLVVAIVALLAALGGGAYAASNGLTSKQKAEVKKIAKKYAGKPGDAGPAGPQGPPGQPDVSNFYNKAEADSHFAQVEPGGGFEGAVFSNHVVISPPDGTTATPVLSLPGGFTVNCYPNGTNNSLAKVVGTSPWSGSVLYNEGTTMFSAGVGNTVGGGAPFGSAAYGTARYQIMDSGATTPTRVWTITVTIIRGNSTGITGGPYCNAEAIAGPA